MDLARRLFDQYLATGDEAALERLVRRTRPRLLRIARRIGAPQDAEDAVQSAYVALLRRRPADAPVEAWLVTAVVRLAYRRKAIEKRQADLARRLARARGDGATPPALAAGAERRRHVRAGIARLPPRLRDAVVLHYLEGLPAAAVARLLDVPEATVRTRLFRGRAALRGRLATVWALLLAWTAADALGGLAMKKKAAVASLVLFSLLAFTVHGWRADPPRSADAESPPRAVAAALPSAPPPDEAVPAPTEGPRVRGTVVDRDGRPVPGARVALFVDDDVARPVQEWGATVPAPAHRTRANAAGRFELPWSAAGPRPRLRADADGFAPGALDVQRPRDDVVLVLERGGTLSGRVLDLDSAPVAGARVTWRLTTRPLTMERSAVTDSDGRYALAGLPAPWQGAALPHTGFQAVLEVSARGFAPVSAYVAPPTPRTGADLRRNVVLGPGAIVRGRVVDAATRRPLPGARVLLRGAPAAMRIPVLGEAIADAQGRFAFARVPAEGFHDVLAWSVHGAPEPIAVVLRADADGYAPVAMDLPAANDGATVEVELACPRAATVRGRVVDARGVPLEAARVRASNVDHPVGSFLDYAARTQSARTDAAGRYRFDRVAADAPVDLSAERDGWPGPRREIVVRPGEAIEAPDLVWTGPRVPAVAVQVVDADGAPVHGAAVQLKPEGGHGTTRSDGRIGLWAGQEGPASVVASSRDSGVKRVQVELARDRPAQVRVVLDATATIGGTVRYTDGTPAAAAWVSAWRGRETVAQAYTDIEGRFLLRRLPDGEYPIVAAHYGEAPSARAPARVATGTMDVLLELDGRPAVPTTSVEGRVRDRDGRPVLRFCAWLGRSSAERTAPGRFRIDGVPAGNHWLRVRADGFGTYVQRDIRIEPGAAPPRFDVRLGPGARVHGSISGGSVRWIGLLRTDGFRTQMPRGASARFEITSVPPGRYRFALSMARGLAPALPNVIDVAATDREVEFDIELVPGGPLRLPDDGPHTVTTPDGNVVWDGHGLRLLRLPVGTYRVDGEPVEVVAD